MSRTSKTTIEAQGTAIGILSQPAGDYISLTDMVRNFDGGGALIEQWLKNKDTVLFLGVWEKINHPGFNSLEFEAIRNEAGRNSFFLSAKKWITRTGAKGLIARTGRYGGTEKIRRSRSQNAILKRGMNIKHLPHAFTEHGAIQAANVLNSDAAIEMGVHVVRAFVRLRQWLGTQKAFAAKLDALEARVGGHDEQLAAVIEALRQLTASSEPTHDRKMGFHRGNR